MNEQRNNGKGIFYGVIGVATLIVAIIGATFAYFTASQTNNNKIKGNAATISFGLNVRKVTTVDETQGGMIPMTDGMVKAAVTAPAPCKDQADNAVCQIYEIKVTNTGSAIIFLDGYVTLTGGAPGGATSTPTTMRWAQVYSADNGTTFTVSGTPALAPGQTTTGITAMDLKFSDGSSITSGTSLTALDNSGTTDNYELGGNNYAFINKNYMRKSTGVAETLGRSNLDNALVFSQRLAASGDASNYHIATYYIVVWLTETGSDQTLTSDLTTNFFSGKVDFQSGAGSEVSATFGGYVRTQA